MGFSNTDTRTRVCNTTNQFLTDGPPHFQVYHPLLLHRPSHSQLSLEEAFPYHRSPCARWSHETGFSISFSNYIVHLTRIKIVVVVFLCCCLEISKLQMLVFIFKLEHFNQQEIIILIIKNIAKGTTDPRH